LDKAVLFISHDASRTGAPFLLLHFLRWLRANTSIPFVVFLKRDGPLRSEFESLAPVICPPTFSAGQKFVNTVYLVERLKASVSKGRVLRSAGRAGIGLIYSNTVTNGEVLRLLNSVGSPVITHAHELEYSIKRYCSTESFAQVLKITDRFIAGCEAVKRNLISTHGVPAARVDVVHEFVPTSQMDITKLRELGMHRREELGIPEQALVVTAAGTADWRKGFDLFLPLALNVIRRCEAVDPHLVWVGAVPARAGEEFAYDLAKLGLARRVHVVGERTDYLAFLALTDIFCLLSREDPFPLVVLEAGYLAKPIVCFEHAGGVPEFLLPGCGYVTPYLDLEAMADRIAVLGLDVALRQTMGRAAANRVAQSFDVEVLAPKLLEQIQRYVS
jgi:glycosyltransferase involved in cell wall biosynthesis